MKYLSFPFLLLLLPLIGFGCSSDEEETDSLILSSDSELILSKALTFPLFREHGLCRSRQGVRGGSR